MQKFKEGDSVIVNKSGFRYGYTKPGSTGIILKYREDSNSYEIEFDFLNGRTNQRGKERFLIDSNCIDFHSKDVNSLVINKIKQMQARRKELGYAF
jgi:hypothetical protein